MAKSIRSKVKKRLRTVKRGVLKRELSKPETKVGARELAKEHKLAEALSGHLKPSACHEDTERTTVPGHRSLSHSPALSHAPRLCALPGKRVRNAFRSDEPDAVIPQHNWRQGPDFRSGSVPEAGYAVVGSNRPKVGRFGGDAPSARSEHMQNTGGEHDTVDAVTGDVTRDDGVARLMRGSEQIVPQWSSNKAKRRLKKGSGVQVAGTKAFRWC